MTTQTDAIKLAIEALERNKRGLKNIELFGKSNVKFSGLTEMIEKTDAALAALQEQAREGEADCRIELVTAVHMLASHYENNLYNLNGDEEALRLAKGDIAHAMKIAAKWNWNGSAPQVQT